MAWWDTLIDVVSNVGSTVASNPALAGAAAYGITKATGGSDRDAALWGLGAGGASYLYNNGVPSFLGGQGSVGGPSAQTVGQVGMQVPGAVAPVAQAATTAASALPTFGGESGSIGLLDSATAGLEKLQKTANKYGKVLDLGAQGLSALTGMQANRAKQEAMDMYRQKVDAANARNDELIAAENKARGDIYADQRTQVARAGLMAQKGIDMRTAGDIAEIDSARGLDTSAKAALKQKAKVSGAKAGAQAYNQADYTARAGLRAPGYASYGGTSYDSSYAKDLGGSGDTGYAAGLMNMYEGLTGRKKSDALKQVGTTTGETV